jgi:hypothetical protein
MVPSLHRTFKLNLFIFFVLLLCERKEDGSISPKSNHFSNAFFSQTYPGHSATIYTHIFIFNIKICVIYFFQLEALLRNIVIHTVLQKTSVMKWIQNNNTVRMWFMFTDELFNKYVILFVYWTLVTQFPPIDNPSASLSSLASCSESNAASKCHNVNFARPLTVSRIPWRFWIRSVTPSWVPLLLFHYKSLKHGTSINLAYVRSYLYYECNSTSLTHRFYSSIVYIS